MARTLVTTAIEETWPKDGSEIVFLGEWCKVFNRRQSLASLNHTVLPYHWDDRNKLGNDYHALQFIYEIVIKELASHLNQMHGVNRSLRYWRILLGPWLGYYLPVIFDRWFMLKNALECGHIDSISVLAGSSAYAPPNSTEEAISIFSTDRGNEELFGHIIGTISDLKPQVVFCNDTKTSVKLSSRKGKLLKNIFSTLVNCLSSALAFTSYREKYFFISTYLPFKSQLLIQGILGQFPALHIKLRLPVFRVSNKLRSRSIPFRDEGCDKRWREFMQLISSLLPKHMPRVFLEGYFEMAGMSRKIQWPKNPKLIFTSNSWEADEIFKVWAADKVENGAPLVIGQHGGNYGVAAWNFFEDHEVKISDSYLTWGWFNPSEKNLKAIGNLKLFGASTISYNPTGNALLVQLSISRYSGHLFSIPIGAAQWNAYLEEQFKFIDALTDVIKKSIIVRLAPSDYGLCQHERWKDRFPNIAVDDGLMSIKKLIKDCRVYISTYNATTYLESLALNIPTIIFWNPLHSELRDSAKPYFDLLKNVGIFHESPEAAALFMADVWDDIDGWWFGSGVQEVREIFCEKFSRIPDNPMLTLAAHLKNIAA